MAAQTWPATLPQGPASFELGEPEGNTIRTTPDNGPTKSRRRFTKQVTKGTMSFMLTIPQYQTFKDFYRNNLNFGTQRFNFFHPWDQVIQEFKMTSEPKYSAEGTLAVNVSFSWEVF